VRDVPVRGAFSQEDIEGRIMLVGIVCIPRGAD